MPESSVSARQQFAFTITPFVRRVIIRGDQARISVVRAIAAIAGRLGGVAAVRAWK
jgi:hypothetical protein